MASQNSLFDSQPTPPEAEIFEVPESVENSPQLLLDFSNEKDEDRQEWPEPKKRLDLFNLPNLSQISLPPTPTESQEIVEKRGRPFDLEKDIAPGMARCFSTLLQMSKDRDFKNYMLEMVEAKDVDEYETKFRQMLATQFDKFEPKELMAKHNEEIGTEVEDYFL